MPGKKTLCSKEVADAIAKLISNTGCALNAALINVGIPSSTGLEWRDRGEGKHPTKPQREPYIYFARKVREAEVQAEITALAVIQRAGLGGLIEERTEYRYELLRDEHGNPRTDDQGNAMTLRVPTKTTEFKKPGDWQAKAWFLERVHRERYGRNVRFEGEVDVNNAIAQVPAPAENADEWLDAVRKQAEAASQSVT